METRAPDTSSGTRLARRYRSTDFSPLYRSTVGFDRLFDLLNQSARGESPPNWPLYNIERTGEDDYRITMALGGFSPDEVDRSEGEHALHCGAQARRARAKCSCTVESRPGLSGRASTLPNM
jgi:HSP20 family molecular chaperone IbpA